MGEQVKKKLTPTIRCCSQHLMVGVIFGGGIICSTIGKITCEKCPKSRMGEQVKKKITPTIRCCEQHLMVGHKFVVQLAKSLVKNALSPEWENRSKKNNPNHQMLWTAPDSWGIISSTIGKITCEKCPKSRMGEQVKKKLTPTIRCCSQHLMVGVIFGGRHNL